MNSTNTSNSILPDLDALTGGALSATTAGERAMRIRDWLATEPSVDDLTHVFRELSSRDRGAAKPIRERLDEIKRARHQDSLGRDWAERGNALLQQERINIADAMAWQRDAAKAGAPLSREPLLGLKKALADRVQGIEDLQHRAMVHREAAVLLAQRIELLSTKSWREAQDLSPGLAGDVEHWQQQGSAFAQDANWPSVDVRTVSHLDGAGKQLHAVWEAFDSALSLALASAADPSAELPAVPVWAEEIRATRAAATEVPPRPSRPRVDPELKAHATELVSAALQVLESEIAQGHGKASAGAANTLRNALRDHGRMIEERLDHRAQAALAAAGELEDWQRWRADQLREELVGKAEGLLQRAPGQALGGRKMQELLRELREQWKLADHGGAPNQGLWRRFDHACNEAYKVVQAWLDRIKAEAAQNREQRLALIEEMRAWGAEHAQSRDWKFLQRSLNQFSDGWRNAGHLSEKALAELQPIWSKAIDQAASGLQAEQLRSREQRQALILEAEALGAGTELRVDSVRELQQRWQAEAQSVPLERREEQKLWERFRKPIDAAFQRKTLEREQAAARQLQQMGEHDRQVLAASQRLEEAGRQGDAQQIRSAMQVLEQVLRGAPLPLQASVQPSSQPPPVSVATEAREPAVPLEIAASSAAPAEGDTAQMADAAPAADPVKPVKPVKAVIAVRGDDRPGLRRAEPPAAKFGAGAHGPGRGRERTGPNDHARGSGGPRTDLRGAPRDGGPWRDARPERDRGPRLGEQAFRAQREAMDRADLTLRKLSAQAHGEVLGHLMTAWEQRDPNLLPTAQLLGPGVNGVVRGQWAQSLTATPQADSQPQVANLLLRLEVAAELPSPADQQEARRAMQLFLLTRRNDPTPAQTWPQDVTKLLACRFDPAQARRMQTLFKTLLKH